MIDCFTLRTVVFTGALLLANLGLMPGGMSRAWGAPVPGADPSAGGASASVPGASGATAPRPASAPGEPAASAAVAKVPPKVERQWLPPRPSEWGRLQARQLGLVINEADPYSVQVGEHYARVRRLAPQQILRLSFPVKPQLSPPEFDDLARRIQSYFGEDIQALALAWVEPWAVGCNSITGALALGFDPKVCVDNRSLCGPTRPSPYFDSPTVYPYTRLGLRPSMLLAAGSVAAAKGLINRGARADGSLYERDGPDANARFVTTPDAARSVRSLWFPPAGRLDEHAVNVHLDQGEPVHRPRRVLLYMTGSVAVPEIERIGFLPGALADHLTSFGGRLTDPWGQMSALRWIDAGATASYGTVSEPCSHPEKFPTPQVLLLRYMAGATALEAYWKSVLWPQQGVFIGDPLAAPFAPRPAR